MTHRILLITILFLFGFISQSCEKDNLLEQPVSKGENLFQIGDSSDKAASILIAFNHNTKSVKDEFDGIVITGRFKNNQEESIEAETFEVNKLVIPFSQNGRIEHSLNLPEQIEYSEFDKIGKEMIDNEIAVKVVAKEIGTFEKYLYCPKPIKAILVSNEINKNEVFRVKWEALNHVNSSHPESVGLMLIYRPGHSIANNPNLNLPNETITIFKYAEDETEGITVSPEELAVFPEGGEVFTYLARGREETVNTLDADGNEKETVISLVSYSSTPGIVVKN